MLSIGQFIADFARGEAALRTEAQAIERDIFGSFVDSGDDRSLILQHRRFRGYQTQNHLLAISHILQWFETTRTLIVILQIEGIYIFMSEKIRSYGILGTFGGIAGMIIATAYVGVDAHPLRFALDGKVVHLQILQGFLL